MSWTHEVWQKIMQETHMYEPYLRKFLQHNPMPGFQTSRIVYGDSGDIMIPKGFRIWVTGLSVKGDEVGGVIDFVAGEGQDIPGQICPRLACLAFNGMERFLADIVANNLQAGMYE
jgi:hypothetical protein